MPNTPLTEASLRALEESTQEAFYIHRPLPTGTNDDDFRIGLEEWRSDYNYESDGSEIAEVDGEVVCEDHTDTEDESDIEYEDDIVVREPVLDDPEFDNQFPPSSPGIGNFSEEDATSSTAADESHFVLQAGNPTEVSDATDDVSTNINLAEELPLNDQVPLDLTPTVPSIQADSAENNRTEETTPTDDAPLANTLKRRLNTTGSSFTDNVKAAFAQRLELKGPRCQAFTASKYANYLSIVRDGADAVSPPPGLSQSARDYFIQKRRRIFERFEFYDDKLYKRNPRRPVVLIGDACDVVDEFHATLGHPGYNKTWDRVQHEIYGITVEDVEWLVKRCTYCYKNQPNQTRAPLVPIISMSPMERVQMDLVDLRKHPSKQYQWFINLIDHFTKVSWVYPLKRKFSVPIAKVLNSWIRMNGPPRMIQCDNGNEFKGAVKRLLKKRGIKMVHGRPRHPQSQGLVEQKNGVHKKRITKYCDQNSIEYWHNALDFIRNASNVTTCAGLPRPMTPHYAFFSVPRRLQFDKHVWAYDLTDAQMEAHYEQTGSDSDF